ncbi:MAG TPA: hypothetical protein VEL11_03510 [Candidatus Bathyarchaeia archaeon]|nr:hypothetical protein [Candidatus Bathyarchaeia archaeon]
MMYTDKTDSNVRTSKVISKYLSLLKDMHDYITSGTIQSFFLVKGSISN